MEDILLKELFCKERWERAIEVGVGKGINKSMLRQLCSPETRKKFLEAIANGNYEIAPPHEAKIPKDNGDFRIVYVNEGFDRVALSIINDMLFDLYPNMIHPQCTSYQKGIGTGKVVKEVVKYANKSGRHLIGWKADLSKYFDSVPLEFIDAVFDKLGPSKVIDAVRKYYHSDLCFDVDGNLIHHYASLKQGCAVAAFLADVMLYHIDEQLSKLNGYYVRYSDDILFIGKDAPKAMKILKKELAELHLTLNPNKVEDLYRDEWFKFLGFNIKGDKITLSKSRVKKFQKEIEARTIKKHGISLRKALNSVNRFLYVGDGEYSWATSVLSIVNVDKDIDELNKFVLDALKAVATGKCKIGGLGSVNDLPDRTICRGIGRNVAMNRKKVMEIEGYSPIQMMRKALLTNRVAYNTLVRQM